MKKLGMLLMLLLAMLIGSHRVFAQSVTITLTPGWNWISCPTMDTLDFATALGSFTPMQGDIIKSRWGSAVYRADGRWWGSVSKFYPGYGYHYMSNRQAPVMVTFNAQQPTPQVIVTTAEPTDITTNSATCGGNVASSDGNYVFVILRGICWSTNPNPTFNDNYIEAGNGIGSFTASMTDLTPNTTFYVRVFAVTPSGTFYGDEISFHTQTWSNGILPGAFSVSANQQVYFSQGNLQYQASTNTWRFAENQWDYVGSANSNISPTYDGWIDLFGWGTSGWNNGNVYYQPYDSESNYDPNTGFGYGPTNGTNYGFSLTGEYANADWGIYNAVLNGGNMPGLWRALTKYELDYIFNTRSTLSGIRYAKAQVNGVNGVILLPDSWNISVYALNYTNASAAPFTENMITVEDWAIMESEGAVFLPAAGYRNGTAVSDVNNRGNYWSTTYYISEAAYAKHFDNSGIYWVYGDRRSSGYSVRLVRSEQ